MNADPQSPFRTDELIAFGDFLTDQSKVQAADVGVKLVPKESSNAPPEIAIQHKLIEDALARLKCKSSMLQPRVMQDWMLGRSYSKLQ